MSTVIGQQWRELTAKQRNAFVACFLGWALDAFETLPEKGRGFFSGLLQEGYVVGNLLAALVYATVFPHLHGHGLLTNWRVMFFIGALPSLLVFYIRAGVDESPVWKAGQAQAVKPSLSSADVSKYLGSFLLLVVMMFAFTSFSHGSQDLYPTFLQKGKHFDPAHVGTIAVIANLGGLLGGICFGTWSERLGRRKGIIIASLLAIPMIPLWAFSHWLPLVALGGFLMQFMVQGAWGIIPAHLNELSPAAVRATFPGFAYQMGNLLSSRNAKFQTVIARRYFGGALQMVMAGTIAIVALLVALTAYLGRDARGRQMTAND